VFYPECIFRPHTPELSSNFSQFFCHLLEVQPRETKVNLFYLESAVFDAVNEFVLSILSCYVECCIMTVCATNVT